MLPKETETIARSVFCHKKIIYVSLTTIKHPSAEEVVKTIRVMGWRGARRRSQPQRANLFARLNSDYYMPKSNSAHRSMPPHCDSSHI